MVGGHDPATSKCAGTAGTPAWWHLAALGLALFAAWLSLRPIWDVDIFWHVAAGRWMLEHLRLPDMDIFSSIDPQRTWVPFQWLYEVLTALLDRIGGFPALRAVHAALAALGAFLFYRSARRFQLSPLAALACTALLLLLFSDRFRVRPHMVNLVFFALFIGHHPWRWERPRAWSVVLATLAMFLWANLHAGGALIGLVLLAARPAGITIAAWVRGRQGEHRWIDRGSVGPAWAAWGALLLGAVLAPGFVRGAWQAYAMLEGSEQLITEWLPFWHYAVVANHPVHWLGLAAPVLVGAGAVVYLLRAERPDLGGLLTVLALAALPIRSIRFVWMVALALPILAAGLPRLKLARPLTVTALALALLLAGQYHLGVLGSFGLSPAEAFTQHLDERRFPVEAADHLEERLPAQDERPARIFCLPNWGGYLLYRLHPRIRVAADGRGNFPEDLGAALLFIYSYRHDPRHVRVIMDIYERWGGDLLVVQHPVFPRGVDPPGWERTYRDRKGEIWRRRPAAGQPGAPAAGLQARGLVALAAGVARAGVRQGGARRVTPMSQASVRSFRQATRSCLEHQRRQLGSRAPLCLALAGGDLSQCARLVPELRPLCLALASWRRALRCLRRALPVPDDDALEGCPISLAPGVELNEAACRSLPLNRMILPRGGGRADLVLKTLNPYDEQASCELHLKATWSGGEEQRDLVLSLPPRAALDRTLSIRYDAETLVDLRMECKWSE